MKASSFSDHLQWALEQHVKDEYASRGIDPTVKETAEKVEELTEQLVAKLIPLLKRGHPL